MLKKLVTASLITVLTLSLSGCGTSAQTNTTTPAPKIAYPTNAVTVEHGFSPGGGSDQLSQLTQPFLEKVLGQKFVNVYKPGADGAIAWKEIGKAKPDGYTLGTLMTPKIELNSMINKEAGYKMEDFVPIANMVYDPGIFIVPPDSKFNSMKDIVDYAKANPGKLGVANSGTGGNGWYNAVMIQTKSGTKWNNVPFQGDGPTATAVAGGNIEAGSTNVAQVTEWVRTGKVKALAVYTDKRLDSLPNIPTLKEQGIDFSTGSYRGYLAPKGTPKEIVDILANGLEKVSQMDEFKQACAKANISIKFMKGEDYQKFLDGEYANLKKVVEDNKLGQ